MKRRKIGFTDQTLDTQKGHFKNRLDMSKGHWPGLADTNTHARCQLHTWASSSKVRKKSGVMLCMHCNVYLCMKCWKIFHQTEDLVKDKDEIKKMILDKEHA